ncbi:hypothetical protein KM043_000009, partial [Ampulex compressa]
MCKLIVARGDRPECRALPLGRAPRKPAFVGIGREPSKAAGRPRKGPALDPRSRAKADYSGRTETSAAILAFPAFPSSKRVGIGGRRWVGVLDGERSGEREE